MGRPAAPAQVAAQPPPVMPAPELNLGSADQQTQTQPAAPPKPDLTPGIVQFIQQMFGKGGLQDARIPGGTGQVPLNAQGQVAMGQEPQAPTRPASRLDAFENFVGNVLYSFSQGMAGAGQGPAANARGFGIAAQAPYQRELGQFQLGQQAQQQQAQTALTQAQAQHMGQMVDTPYGMMPLQLAQRVWPAGIGEQGRLGAAQIGAQAKLQAAQLNRFASGPWGIYDKQTGKLTETAAGGGGIGATIKVTPEIAQELGNGWDQLIGKNVKIETLDGAIRAHNGGMSVAQGADGAFLLDRARAEATGGKQGITPLGQGSPAANPIANLRLQISNAKDLRTVQTNQNEVNLALNALNEIRENSGLVQNAIDAGRIELGMAADGTARMLAGRGVTLTDKEAKFAADFQTLMEKVNLLRIPLGAAGFRGPEGWFGLQSQKGSLAQNPQVFNGVLDNTIQSFQALRDANQGAIDVYQQTAGRLNRNAPPARGNKQYSPGNPFAGTR